jgi:hypothetical protein
MASQSLPDDSDNNERPFTFKYGTSDTSDNISNDDQKPKPRTQVNDFLWQNTLLIL